jgi:DNA polymerase/3'-5' exonuclease PolX
MALPSNEDIATHLQQISHLFTKTKRPGDQYRSQAFSRAASEVRGHRTSILNEDGVLATKIPGVGEAIQDVINEFAKSGTSAKMEKLKNLVPNEVIERFQAKVCKRKVNEVLAPLTEQGIDWGYAGSMRRGMATVRDVDVIVVIKNGNERDAVLAALTKSGLKPDVRDGEQKIGASIAIASQGRSFTLDLNFCTPETRGSYYLYFTGSKDLNIRMRSMAKKDGLLLNQHGLWRGDICIASKTEEEIFEAMELDYIPPEKR